MDQLLQESSPQRTALLTPPADGLVSAGTPAAVIDTGAMLQLTRMFRDPRVLEESERRDLVIALRHALERAPHITEIRVLLGMALAVDLQAQEALEHLRVAAEQNPGCFIARLKYGELLMRLRICGKAAEETHEAARLASNVAQSDLARVQAEKIRTMLREGIERGGYPSVLSRVFRRRNRLKGRNSAPVLIAAK